MTPITLALESSGPSASVALDNGAAVRVVSLPAGQRGLSGLFPLIQELLRDAGASVHDVGLVCFSRGPGSFTGLRTAATIARMLQFAVGCRVVGVPTLEVIACNALAGAREGDLIAPVLDARGGRFFAAAYRVVGAADLHEVCAPRLFREAELRAALPRDCRLLGDAAPALADPAAAPPAPDVPWQPSAEWVLRRGLLRAAAGQVCRAEEIAPDYLRPPECEEVFDARKAAAQQRRAGC